MPIPAIAMISTAKGNEGMPYFIGTDTNTPNFILNLSLNELEEFIITRKYNENVSKRNYETLYPKDIPPLESSNNIYGTFPTSLRCSASSIDFHGDKYDCSNNKQDKKFKNDICEFLLDEIRFLRGEIVLKSKIIKSLFTVESTSRDEQNFTYKIERIKNDKKKIV